MGSAPKTAASVVMRIGRKRSMLASCIAFSADSPASTRWRAKSTIMIPFFLTIPIRIKRSLLTEQDQRQQTSHQCCRKCRKHGQWVYIALVQDGEDYVHHEHGQR